jgi:hypothetical protein
MNNAPDRGAWQRLLALTLLSTLLHAAAIAWLVHRPSLRPLTPAGHPLHARLAPVRPSAPPTPATPQRHVATAPAPSSTTLPEAAPDSAPAPASNADDDLLPLSPRLQLPAEPAHRYRTAIPPSGTLAYEVQKSEGGAPAQAAGEALIEWRRDLQSYSLRYEGVPESALPGLSGATLESRGVFGDNGLLPEGGDNGGGMVVQDRTSLLIQLAAIGTADPDQIDGIVAIDVGVAEQQQTLMFEVVGEVQLETALGTIATRRLVQLVRPGQARLEVWLAPRQHWMPVRLRTTWPDGTIVTHTVRRIGDAGR